MVSNRREDHEISMLALHLIQNCMVYINTLMIQTVLARPHWQGRLTLRDYAALTPLICKRSFNGVWNGCLKEVRMVST